VTPPRAVWCDWTVDVRPLSRDEVREERLRRMALDLREFLARLARFRRPSRSIGKKIKRNPYIDQPR
jgi:hypothetical protein